MSVKTTLSRMLKPLIPIAGWSIIIFKPEYSVINKLVQIYPQVTPNEIRAIDILVYSIFCTYSFMLMEWLFYFISNIKLITIQMNCEDTKTRNNSYVVLDTPDGELQRIKITIEVARPNPSVGAAIIDRIYQQLYLKIKWPNRWVSCELDDIEVHKYTTNSDYLMIKLSELIGDDGGKGVPTIAIATIHTKTESGYILADICSNCNVLKGILNPFIRLLFNYNKLKYELRLYNS